MKKDSKPFLKLNLGCGTNHLSGYINVDIDPAVHPDKIADLTKPLPFPNSSAQEILLQDVLEHFTKEQGFILLQECWRVLKPNGQIRLRVPNLTQIINQFGNDEPVMLEFIYGTTAKSGVYGSHRFGFTRQTLTQTLRRASFTKINIITQTTNFLATAIKAKIPPLNLLVIHQAPDWGGAEELITQIISRVRSVTAVTNYPPLLDRWHQLKITTIKLPFILDIIGNYKGLIKSLALLPYAIFWYLRLLRRTKNRGVNLILMSGFSEKLLVTWLAQLFRLPVVWLEYGPLKPVFSKLFYFPKICYRLTKHLPRTVITLTENTKQSLITDARVSLSKIKVIPPGTELHPAHFVTKPIVGCLSRVAEEKGQRLLLQAWPKVLARFPQAKLKIAGRGPDLPYLKKLAVRSVEFLGFITNKSKFYNSLAAFVFPSTWDMEGFGLVMIEALAHGVPVIAFNRPPASEIIDPSVGLLTDDLASGIIKLLSQSRHRLSPHAQAKVKANYLLSTQTDKIISQLCLAQLS